MWGAFIRQLIAFLLTRRGKRALAFVGMLLLVFTTALLLDSQLYMSAGVTGVLVAIVAAMWLVQYWRVKQQDRLRERMKAAAAAERAAARQARSEKLDRAKNAVVDVAKSAGESAAGAFSAAKTGFANVGSRARFWRGKDSSRDNQT